MQQAGAYANPTTITPEAKDYIKTTTENSAEVAENYYKSIVDDPVARWNAIIPEGDAEMKDGILTSGDDEFNFNKNEDGSYVDPVSVEKFVRELVLNDSTIGNTKEDRALVKQIIDSIGIDVEEEVVLTEEQELEVGKNYSLIQEKINNILPSFEGSSSLDSIGGRTKLKKDVENIVKNAIPLLQQRDKSIKTEQQVVERLIKLSSKKGTSNYNPKLVKALNIYMQLTEQE